MITEKLFPLKFSLLLSRFLCMNFIVFILLTLCNVSTGSDSRRLLQEEYAFIAKAIAISRKYAMAMEQRAAASPFELDQWVETDQTFDEYIYTQANRYYAWLDQNGAVEYGFIEPPLRGDMEGFLAKKIKRMHSRGLLRLTANLPTTDPIDFEDAQDEWRAMNYLYSRFMLLTLADDLDQ
jgi:hypothetical protein